MSDQHVVLFYKRLVLVGGAEVLLCQHYQWLKSQGKEVTVVCFEHADLDRIDIDADDLVVASGTMALLSYLRSVSPSAQIFCHSGYIEFGLAAFGAGRSFAVFLHQPTTMSFNEQDKMAGRFFGNYTQFARHDGMYDQICELRRGLGLGRRLYVECRSYLSQFVLRRARRRFVLSNYAVREKKEIFGLDADFVCGALESWQVDEVLGRRPKTSGSRMQLVTVSRLDVNKRIDVLIQAVQLLKQDGHEIYLKIGGTGPARDELEAQVASLNLEENVEFLGYVQEKDIPALYEQMDLFATIDWADYRLTTYEVLAHARKVLVSDDTEVDPSLMDAGYLFVSSPDPISLAGEIERAIKTPIRWNLLELEQYLREFTWAAYFSKIDKLLAHG